MSDVSLLAKDQVLAQLNADNPPSSTQLPLTFTQIAFSDPRPSTVDPQRNSELDVSALEGTGFRGVETFYYNRMQLGDFTQLAIPELTVSTATLSAVLTAFNALYNTNLATTDIADGTVVPTLPPAGSSVDLVLNAHPNSYAYIGSITVTLLSPVA
jgi:hypothetical protein